ncbi:hypothetical protein MTO96_030467 [Rhipicephalus appendiculatus]
MRVDTTHGGAFKKRRSGGENKPYLRRSQHRVSLSEPHDRKRDRRGSRLLEHRHSGPQSDLTFPRSHLATASSIFTTGPRDRQATVSVMHSHMEARGTSELNLGAGCLLCVVSAHHRCAIAVVLVSPPPRKHKEPALWFKPREPPRPREEEERVGGRGICSSLPLDLGLEPEARIVHPLDGLARY